MDNPQLYINRCHYEHVNIYPQILKKNHGYMDLKYFSTTIITFITYEKPCMKLFSTWIY